MRPAQQNPLAPIGFGLILLLAAGGRFVETVQAADFQSEALKVTARYQGRLEELARWCEVRGLAEQAEQTRKWLKPRDPHCLYIAVLPRTVGRPKLPDGVSADVVEWDTRLAKLQREQADSLYDLARRAVIGRRSSLGFDLLLTAVHECPDHEGVRLALGFQQQDGLWRTHEELANLRAGLAWHDRFGWLPQSHVARYEQGQRFYKNRWISAEEDARLHADILSGWDVLTDHYKIRTNLSLEKGAELGRNLERLYGVWKQLFVRYYSSESQLSSLFNSRSRSRRAEFPRYRVVYFRNRNEYNEYLRPANPNIGISTGMYDGGAKHAYFFAGTDYDQRNVYHEATHQLFSESRPVSASLDRTENFWIIEGIAMYMESLREEEGFYVLGGFDDVRMVAARHRLLHDNFYVPFAEFTTMTMGQLQNDPRIATLYSQAAGQTHFLIHHDRGRYREALVLYLSAVYGGRAGASALFQATGVDAAGLDRQYREFLQPSHDE